ncbi:MAG TPA: DinB family protein [Anaerolineales bacterium]|nr:DinB family protein [Anaerolineales bacterium]
MTDIFLEKLFEHNNWANQKIIKACYALSDNQLDAEPQSATRGTIRRTLLHLVHSQLGYLSLLTMPVDERPDVAPTFAELQESARISGEGLLALAKGEQKPFASRLQTKDGFYTEPWVVMLQVINHATEHREQIKSMLSALGVTPPDIDGWDYGEANNALIPIST